MREVSKFIRQAYLSVLEPLEVDGVEIPIYDEIINPNASKASYLGSECYVIITGQNETETTNNRCSFRQSVALTLQIFSKYPLGSGGKLATENIADTILQQIRILNAPGVTVGDPFQVLSTRKESSQSFIFNGENSSTYQKNLTFSHVIYQDPEVIVSSENTLQATLQFQI